MLTKNVTKSFTKSFKISGSSLALMHPGEKGTVSNFKNVSEPIVKKLMHMGITPGTSIVLEQRFPHVVVKAGLNRHILDDRTMRSIYVRLAE